MADTTRNLFIPHIHEDDDRLRALKDLLRKNGWEIRDGSIDSSKPNEANNPDYIKAAILAPRIEWAGAILVLISRETHRSPWVDWEIEYAHKKGKRIVGVWDRGATDANVPAALDKFADAVVGWQAERVMDAISGKIDNWETASGQIRPPRNSSTGFVRIRCQ